MRGEQPHIKPCRLLRLFSQLPLLARRESINRAAVRLVCERRSVERQLDIDDDLDRVPHL
jgi:hypothetical protein